MTTTPARIRRIEEHEGPEVAALWNRMAQEMPDGGPLPPGGEERIGRMLASCAWHHLAFCLVAVEGRAGGRIEDACGEAGRIVGYTSGTIDQGDGLLPPPEGEIECLYVVPEWRGRGIGQSLARAAVAHLWRSGVRSIGVYACIGAPEVQDYWRRLGFEAESVFMALYGAHGAGAG
ncbi:GNAT family N-acetyltransferase [Streptomyces sp. NBC_01304]|uniref:GNAT family N-acetyltransferase n=1 Tax=Streptomyces sp. NBC_01304 TaxID=2903818 RepID=UPI002E165312|nr:GNAT family N-acetyltransferase [Streptomyces sp. NBC_01304]